MGRLNDSQRLFCLEYIKNGLDGKRAAISAGYSEMSAGQQASQLKSKPWVQEEIQRLLVDVEEKSTIEAAELIAELKKLAFAKPAAKVKNSDKIRAIELLGRYLAIWTETINMGLVDAPGASMSPDDRRKFEDMAQQMTLDEANERRAKLLPGVVSQVLNTAPETVEQGADEPVVTISGE